MQRNPVGWFEIYVQDMTRARKFYEAVLDVELTPLAAPSDGPEVEMMSFPMTPDQPGAAGALAKMDGVESGNTSVLVYFSCEDCAVEAGRVASAGGKVEQAKTPIGDYGFIALARDTEDNMVGLHSMK